MKETERMNFAVDLIVEEVDKRLRPQFEVLEKQIKQSLEKSRPGKRPDGLLSVVEAAEYLGVNKKTVRRRLRSGELAGTKIGDAWRIKLSDLNRLLGK